MRRIVEEASQIAIDFLVVSLDSLVEHFIVEFEIVFDDLLLGLD